MRATGVITDGVTATTDSSCSSNSLGYWVAGYPCAVEKVQQKCRYCFRLL